MEAEGARKAVGPGKYGSTFIISMQWVTQQVRTERCWNY